MSGKKKNNSLEDLMNTFGKKDSDNDTQVLDLDKLDVPDDGGNDVSVSISDDGGDTVDSLTIDQILENMTADAVADEVTTDTVIQQPAEVLETAAEETQNVPVDTVKNNKKEKKNKNKNKNKTKNETPEEVTVAPEPEPEPVAPVPETASEPAYAKEEPSEKTEKKKEKKEKKEKEKAPKDEVPREKNKKADKSDTHKKPEKKSEKKIETDIIEDKKEQKEALKNASPAKLVVTLTVICAAVALLLAAVNHFTAPKIAENNQKAILASIREIFDESVQAEEIPSPEGYSFTSLYLVMKGDGICGYSAAVAPTGFGGPINLMVGMDSAGTVVGVDVVSMSETPGLGSKTGGAEFLSQFKGASGDVKVDAISGASISSNAVAEGVRSVTTNLLDLETIAKKRGASVIPYVREIITETTTVTAAPVTDTDTAVPEPPVTTVPVVSDIVAGAPEVSKNENPPEIIVQNPVNENPGVYADYTEVTTEFETLTTEPESSDLTTGESSAVSE